MTPQQISDTILRNDNFHVDLKNLIVFALAIWEEAKPAPYFEDSKMRFFIQKDWYEQSPFLWKQEMGLETK